MSVEILESKLDTESGMMNSINKQPQDTARQESARDLALKPVREVTDYLSSEGRESKEEEVVVEPTEK